MNKSKWILGVICLCLIFWVFVIFTIVIFANSCNKNKAKQEPKQEQAEEQEEILDFKPDITFIPEKTENKKIETFLITAYCPCHKCSEGYGNMTATGKRAVEGRTIAVDPDVIEYGTRLYIDGVGYRTAEDCGALVKGKHIDIYFDSHDKVDAFGKKYAEVEI